MGHGEEWWGERVKKMREGGTMREGGDAGVGGRRGRREGELVQMYMHSAWIFNVDPAAMSIW